MNSLEVKRTLTSKWSLSVDIRSICSEIIGIFISLAFEFVRPSVSMLGARDAGDIRASERLGATRASMLLWKHDLPF
jgi:hypothetical protein